MFLVHAMIFEKKLLCSASKTFHWFLYKNIQFIKLWYKALSCIWHSGRSLGQNESLIRVICAHGRGLKDDGTSQGTRLALWGCVAPRTWNSNKSEKCIIGCFFLVRGGVDRTHMNCLSKCSLYVFVCLFLLLRKLITRSTRASLPPHVCRLSLSWGFY